MTALSKSVGRMLSAFIVLAAMALPGAVQAYEISVINSSASPVRVEVFAIGPDLTCLRLGQKEVAPGGKAIWESGVLCPGGLAGKVLTGEGWTAISETSCLGAARVRRDWTACCRHLNFRICPAPGASAAFCLHYKNTLSGTPSECHKEK